jgi:predicted DNA binding CopG/RHH family protein
MYDIEHDDFVEAADVFEGPPKPAGQDHRSLKKEKRITIRISDHDLADLRNKAAEIGIPYQTLVTAVLHQFAKGKIQLSF